MRRSLIASAAVRCSCTTLGIPTVNRAQDLISNCYYYFLAMPTMSNTIKNQFNSDDDDGDDELHLIQCRNDDD